MAFLLSHSSSPSGVSQETNAGRSCISNAAEPRKTQDMATAIPGDAVRSAYLPFAGGNCAHETFCLYLLLVSRRGLDCWDELKINKIRDLQAAEFRHLGISCQ
jgi:hypothetical protein